MFRVLLYEPEIPPNTGNVIRLCANTGSELHLIEPLGFQLDEARLRRAGLDYQEFATVRVHRSLGACLASFEARVFGFSTKGRRRHSAASFQPGDAFLFGPETRGLPDAVLERVGPEHLLRIPMAPASRSLNLSNAVAIAVYEAWRQLDYGAVEM
ncbi:MAG: tRNA (cytidine(34)-2'-O)-methyltransferase [Pseudomonadota bacterium]